MKKILIVADERWTDKEYFKKQFDLLGKEVELIFTIPENTVKLLEADRKKEIRVVAVDLRSGVRRQKENLWLIEELRRLHSRGIAIVAMHNFDFPSRPPKGSDIYCQKKDVGSKVQSHYGWLLS